METISFINRKGGVGKTTATLSIASGLHRRGYKVLMVDLDSQCCLSHNVGITDDIEPTIYEVLTGEAPITKAISTTNDGDILIGSKMLSEADITLVEKVDLLKKVLK